MASMKKYNRKSRPVSVPVSFPQEACCTIKIENLSRVSSEAGLKEKLVHYSGCIKSIRIIDCQASPANFAYVNCTDLKTANLIVSSIDKKVLLDSNLLTAKLKQGGGGGVPQARHGPSLGSGRGVCTVKVLMDCGPHLTEADLAQHFSAFGDLSSPCKIRLGNPNYAYINFNNPLSAQEARNKSHCVHGVMLRTVPASYNPNFSLSMSNTTVVAGCNPSAQLKGRPGVVADTEFVKTLFPCDSLAGHYVKAAVDGYVEKWSLQAKVTAQGSNICLFAGKDVSVQIERFITSSISEHKAKISSIKEVIDCCYLPVLADSLMQEQFAKLQVPFEVKVLSARSYVPLEKLVQVYSECGEKTLKADELKPFVQPVKIKSIEYCWYWEEESTLKPYDTSISKKLEQAFASKLAIVECIGRFVYKIDTFHMKQTNTKTNKVRRIERRAVNETGKWNASLEITAHSDHILEIKKEILDKLEKCVQEIEVAVPYVEEDPEYFLEIARLGFVSAERAEGCENTIVLRGMFSVVKNVEVQLKDAILMKKLEAVKVQSHFEAVRTPDHWEPQDGKCALKGVRQGTVEWTKVEQCMTGSGFRIKVLRIERIQNRWLWDVYEQSRKRMSSKNSGQVNEKELFHGTRKVLPVKIYNSEQGFDNRLSSRGMWGEGAYFAVRAEYSDNYAYPTPEGCKQMFLVKVITGITYMCPPDSSLKAPPKKADHPSSSHSSGSMFEDERYDSVSGVANGSEVYIIYEHGKVYPAYLITYKTLRL